MKKNIIQNLIKISFIVFVLSVPFSYVYSLNFLENNKSYTSFSLYNIYLIDITAIILVLTVILNLYWHKKSILTFCSRNIARYVPTLVFAVFAFLSFIWSGSPFLSAFWGLRVLIIALSLFAILYLVKNSDFYKNIFFKVLIATGVIEGLIALGQFLFQKSLGLYFLGEGHLESNVLGLARIDLLGHGLLRAYGTFPHPNVLGGFLLFTTVATVWYKSVKYRNILLTVQLIGLGLTFSRSAILGLLLIIFITFLSSRTKRSGAEARPLDSLGMTTIIILLISLSLLFLRSPIQKILSGNDETINIRLEYSKAAFGRFLDSPILGRGWGTGPIELPAFSKFPFYSWELQPVHNIYLLVLSDLGIIGLLIFLYFIYRILFSRGGFKTRPYTENIWRYLFIAYLFIGLFDHYLLTLPQGIFIFFASALLACELEKKEEKIPLRAKSNKIFPLSD